MIKGLAIVKKACAHANFDAGLITKVSEGKYTLNVSLFSEVVNIPHLFVEIICLIVAVSQHNTRFKN